MRIIWTLAMLLCGCSPKPGEKGDEDCEPVTPPDDDCAVWLCFEARASDQVVYYVRWGDYKTERCDEGIYCDEAIKTALREECGFEGSAY